MLQLFSFASVLAIICIVESVTLKPNSESGDQWIYSYHASTSTGNNLSTDISSEWTLSAKLTIQSFKKYKIFKLQDVKTSGFNGMKTSESQIQEFDVTNNDAKILEAGFLVEYQTENSFDKLINLKFLTEDPEWSRNIKRGIASVYQIDLLKFVEGIQYPIEDEEKNIYGTCKIIYDDKISKKNTDSFDISKKINNANCIEENTRKTQWSSTPLGYYTRVTERYYNLGKKIGKNDQNMPLQNIKSNTKFSYWLMTSDRSVHEVKQTQDLTLEKVTKIPEVSDVSKYNLETTPFYNFYQHQEKEPLPNEKIQNKWLKQYEEIKKLINHNTSLHFNEERFHVIEKLRQNLQAMSLDGLNTFKSSDYAEPQMLNIFSSMLPYIGTTSSINFILELITSDISFNLLHLRLLGLFPLYVEDSIETVLENMEALLTMDKIKNDTIKQNFILSFANMVYQCYFVKLAESNSIAEAETFHKKIAEKYIEKYFQLFTETSDYSLRMKYLLGMMNMGQNAIDNLVKIVKNTAESRHCRTLAVYSIKPELLTKKHEVYQTFWPIVKNSSEPFELRAAALSLLLDSNINSSELYSILGYMNLTSHDPAKQQLHNYFYTSVQSGKTDCDTCTIKKLSKTMLEQLNSPETNQGLLTSYHQVSYSDNQKNFETTLNLHVVANPITNFVNVFKLTLNHFNSHQKTGEFAVYIKAEGISSKLYREEYERHYAIKELYKILEEMKILSQEDHSEDLHIEIGLFYERRAIFALHINLDNVDEMSDFIDQIIIYIGNNDIVTMRDVRSLQFSSDVGTPLSMSLNYQHILGTEFKNYDKIFLNEKNKEEEDDDNYVLTRVRSIWHSKLNLVSFNPLTKISHGVSKIFSNQNFVKFKIDYNVYDLSLKWNDNTSYFDTLFDHKFVVFVDNEIGFKEICGRCKPVVFLGETQTNEKDLNIWLWVKDIIVKETNYTPPRFGSNLLHEMIKQSKVSYTGLPFVQPFVLLCYLADYLYYIPQYEISKLSINTDRIVKEPNLSTLKITFINDALDENYKLNLNFNITLALAQRSMPAKKLLNQWNLNLQRQELDTGVYYELHYDDKDKAVKLDARSELDYLPTSPDTDMFSLKPAEPIISRTNISLKEKGVVPISVDVTSLFSVSDDQIIMVNNSKSFGLCQKDYESEYFRDVLHRYTPPTKWCYNASLGLSTYDNYAINFELKNVSEKIRKFIENDLLRPIRTDSSDGEIVKDNTFNVSMIYSGLHSVMNIEVEKEQVVDNYSVPDLVRPWALLKPTSRLIDELRYNVFGLDNVCIIIPKYVISFTGKIIEHDVDSPIIPLIECTNTTRLGLTTNRFTYKLWSDENTFQMGKKEGGYYVMRNGKYLKKNVRAEDYVVNLLNDHTFHITTSRIDLYYNGEYLTIKLKSAFINRMCGLCTTTEFVAPNMMNKYFN